MPIILQSKEDLDLRLVTMHQEGWPIRALARHFSIGRNTVRSAIRKNEERRGQGHDAMNCLVRKKRSSKLDQFNKPIRQLLEKFPKITGQRLFEELTIEGYIGGISILRSRLRELRPQSKREPVIRFETEPCFGSA